MTQGEELKSLIGSEAQRSALLEQIRTVLPVPLADKVARILELTVWLLALLEKKNLSIAKLKQMIFGAQTESAANLSGKGRKDPKKLKAKGHGRNSHRRYTGARRIRVKHPSLRPGQRCPECAKGKLRERKELALAISVRAQPPVGALIHELEQLTKEAAQAPVLFSDDTGMRVGALRKEIQTETKPKRTGIFTSGIVAKLEDYWVSLFFTGRKHAGENLAQVLEELRTWFTDQIDSKKVEPNSGLGKAIEYMRKRWTQLTQFLRIPGAPLDNNEAERVSADPERWMPWNFQATLAEQTTRAG